MFPSTDTIFDIQMELQANQLTVAQIAAMYSVSQCDVEMIAEELLDMQQRYDAYNEVYSNTFAISEFEDIPF